MAAMVARSSEQLQQVQEVREMVRSLMASMQKEGERTGAAVQRRTKTGVTKQMLDTQLVQARAPAPLVTKPVPGLYCREKRR